MFAMTVLVVLALVGCSAPPSAPARASSCPPGQHLAIDELGAAHCVIPLDHVNVGPGCEPVACQAYDDWGRTGGGGNGAILCAAACEAVCEGDAWSQAHDHAEAADAGLTGCPW